MRPAELQPKEEYRLLNKGSSRSDWQIAKITERVFLRHVVNACGREWWPDAAFCRNFHSLSVPLNDDASEDIQAHFRQVLDFMHEAVEAGGKVLVHCIGGFSRSATLVVAYLIAHAGLPFEEALALVKERRPVVEPNSGFVIQLRAFEKIIGARRKESATLAAVNIGNGKDFIKE